MHEGDEDHIRLDDGTFAYTGERIELTSVGIDIGSSTSHLIFSGLVLERQGSVCRAATPSLSGKSSSALR